MHCYPCLKVSLPQMNFRSDVKIHQNVRPKEKDKEKEKKKEKEKDKEKERERKELR